MNTSLNHRQALALLTMTATALGCAPAARGSKAEPPAQRAPEKTESARAATTSAPLPERQACIPSDEAALSVVGAGPANDGAWACYGEASPSVPVRCVVWGSGGEVLRIEAHGSLAQAQKEYGAEVSQPNAAVKPYARWSGTLLEVCYEDVCMQAHASSIPASHWNGVPDPHQQIAVATTPDDKQLLLLSPSDVAGSRVRLQAALLDRSTLKLAHVATSTEALEGFEEWSASWPGKFAILSAQRCCGPDGVTLLVDPRTAEWTRLFGYRGSLTSLGSGTYLVLDEKQVAFVDVERGTIDPGPTLPGTLPDDPEASLARAVAAKSATYVAVAFPPALVRFERGSHRSAHTTTVPVCNSGTNP